MRAGAYVPGWTDGLRRVRGPDEDAFTMAATAIERVVRSEPGPGPPWTVRVVGSRPPLDREKLEGVMGSPVAVREGPPGLPGLGAAIAEAVAGSGRELVIAVDLEPDAAGGTSRTGDVPAEGAVTLWVDTVADGHGPPIDLGTLPSGPHVLPWFLGRYRAEGVGNPSSWVGDSTIDPLAGRPLSGAVKRTPDRPPTHLSEGAYVPTPRYLEGLPSRWRFVADRCSACGRTTFPARGSCRHCGREDQLVPRFVPFDGGRVLAATWIGRGGQPTEFDVQVEASGPYGVVIAELEPGVRATLPVADAAPGELHLDAPIGTRMRRLYPIDGAWRYGRKAVPLAPRAGGPTSTPA